MYTAIVVLSILVSVLLVLIVLVQNPKGGGMNSSFGTGSQVMGVQRTSDFLEKTTWTLVAFLLVMSLSSIMLIDRSTMGGQSLIQKQIDEAGEAPALPSNFSLPEIEIDTVAK